MTREIAPIRPDQIASGVALLFNDNCHADGAPDAYYQAFMQSARRERYDLSRQIVVQSGGGVLFSCLVTPGAGAVASIYASNPAALSPPDQILAVEAMVRLRRWVHSTESCLLQTVLAPSDNARRELFLRSGYRTLTTLDYLYRFVDGTALTSNPGGPPDVSWVTWSAEKDGLFRQTMLATYEESLDCPELGELRTLDEIMASHRAAGQFDPNLWFLLMIDEKPAGLLLLTPTVTRDSIELSYLGVASRWRGRRLGGLLVQKTLEQAAILGKKLVTLAVDLRNLPARAMYHHFLFRSVFQRQVLICSNRQASPPPLVGR